MMDTLVVHVSGVYQLVGNQEIVGSAACFSEANHVLLSFPDWPLGAWASSPASSSIQGGASILCTTNNSHSRSLCTFVLTHSKFSVQLSFIHSFTDAFLPPLFLRLFCHFTDPH